MPAEVLHAIRVMPGNPTTRGIIRNSMQVIMPRTLQAEGDTEHILTWLRGVYHETAQGRSRANQQSYLTPVAEAPPTRVRGATPVTPQPNYARMLDGSIQIRNLELGGSESGTANYRCVIQYRPAPAAGGQPSRPVTVPAAVASQGITYIRDWLRNNAATLGLEEFTEDYEHTDFHRAQLTIDTINLNEAELRRVLTPV